jgi:hypothetical protein
MLDHHLDMALNWPDATAEYAVCTTTTYNREFYANIHGCIGTGLLDTNMAFLLCLDPNYSAQYESSFSAFVLKLTLLFSEPCLDDSFPDFSFFTPTQAVNIAKWSEDVSGVASSQSDLLCLPPILDMGAEAFELKHDAASVYSMDSAYQSQTSSGRRATSMAEGYQSITPQDNRSRVSSQFLGSDHNYSPTLSSDNFAFPEQHADLSHMQLPSAGGDMDSGENAFAYANYTTGQDYSQYTATSVPRFTPSHHYARVLFV